VRYFDYTRTKFILCINCHFTYDFFSMPQMPHKLYYEMYGAIKEGGSTRILGHLMRVPTSNISSEENA
jgi:hypothetical protein